jgi:hypothetical protein
MWKCLNLKYTSFVLDFYEIFTWLIGSGKDKTSNFIKLSCSTQDRWTDTTKYRVAFRNFAKAPENWLVTCFKQGSFM